MSCIFRSLLLGGAALLLAGTAWAQQDAPSGNAANGRKLYQSDGCFECHNGMGQGAAMEGPRIAPDVVPFESFLSQLRRPRSEMPPYEPAVLSDRQAADIYAYLKSIPQPPDVKSIPLLHEN